jgi:hypothetical protein
MGNCNCTNPTYPCPACGTGLPNFGPSLPVYLSGEWQTCWSCGGAGEVWVPTQTINPNWTIINDNTSNPKPNETTTEVDKTDEPW